MYFCLVHISIFSHLNLFKVAMQTRKYLSRLCFISGLFFLASCTNDAQIPSKMVSFEDAFQLQRKIYLDEEIKLTGISSLLFDKNGNILLLDFVSKQVILVTKEGKLIKNISPDTCHPGHDWSPFAANFNKSGNILVLTKIGQIYWFSHTGECIVKGKTLSAGPNNKLAFDATGNFYFKEQTPTETYVHKSDSLGTKTSRFKIDDPFPIRNGFSISTPIDTDGEYLLIVQKYFDGFYVYDQYGKKLKTVKFESPNFKAPKEDIDTRNTKELIKESGKYSVVLNLFKTNFGSVSLNFHRFNLSKKRIGINIYDQKNNILRYVLSDNRAWLEGKDQNDFFYTTFNPSKEDLAACKQCGAKTTWGLNVYQLKNE